MKDHRRQVYVDHKCKWKQPEEAADNVLELELLEAMFLLICNQAWSKNVVPGLVSCVGIPWFWQSFYKAQRVEEILHYHSSIMLNSFPSLLRSKFCWHNVDNPTSRWREGGEILHSNKFSISVIKFLAVSLVYCTQVINELPCLVRKLDPMPSAMVFKSFCCEAKRLAKNVAKNSLMIAKV